MIVFGFSCEGSINYLKRGNEKLKYYDNGNKKRIPLLFNHRLAKIETEKKQ